ncbi:cadherin repeat domain-containing protein [Sulfurimonas sp. HSL3-7]|uniref:cadherin repeat domain-containing protein n=1 Tax=Sulfonitrofixus jiaomeiensis TaxID=3131938 RepID=UPI0031F97D90
MIRKALMASLFITGLIFSGCGEADYSFETVKRLSGLDLINGSFGFTSSDYVIVNSEERYVTDVTTDTTSNVRYSVIGGENGTLFSIDATTGKLSFIAKPSYDPDSGNLYEVIVSAEDSEANRAVQIIEVEVVADITKLPPVIDMMFKEYAVLSFEGVVFNLFAQAADSQSQLIYTLEGTDKAFFSINEKGEVRFTSTAETSGKSSFTIDVIVQDGYGNISRINDVVITKVDSLSEIQPVILSESFKIVENSKGNIAVEVFTAEGVKITHYTLGGQDAAMFAINSDGVLSLIEPQDHESVTAPFEITLQVEDANGQKSVVQPIEVTIVDIDETFLFSGIRDFTVQEGSSGVVTTVEATAKTLPEDLEKHFSLVQGSDYFTINDAGVIQWKATAQKDAKITVQVAVESQLNGSRTLSAPFSIVVVDDPAKIAPTIDNNYPREISVVETQAVLMTIQATVNGNAESLAYALTGADANLFAIDGNGNVSPHVAFDEAGTNVYTFAVVITDNNGNVVTTDTITVTLLQDPDKIRPVIVSTTFNIAENSTGNMNILISSEGNGVVDTYLTAGDDGALFAFDSNGLRFKSGADFESMRSAAGTTSYHLLLQVKDNLGNYSDEKAIVVNVTDVDETLQFTSLNSFTPTEGTTAVGTIKANGKDSTPVTLSYTLHNHTDVFILDAVSGALNLRSPAVAGEHYDLTISAQSQFNGSLTYAPTISVDVAALSYAITFTSQDVATLPQNSVVEVPIEAASAAGRPISYAMAEGTDASIFAIDASTGVMTVHVPAYTFSNDPEANIYRGAVVASDDMGHSATQQGELHIEPVDGLPVFVTPAAQDVNENEKAIAQLEATSPIGSPLTYEKVSGLDSYYFNVTSDGVLTFNIAKDYEDPEDADLDNVYEVEIRVTDTLHPVNTTVRRFTVSVLDVDIAFSSTTTVNVSVDDGEYTLFWANNTVTDLELSPTPGNGVLDYTIVSNPDSRIFSMPSSGVLRVDAPPVSSDKRYVIVVGAHKDNGTTVQEVLYVTILN